MSDIIRPVLDQAREDVSVLAVILFGSQARGDATAASDVDLCLVLSPARRTTDDLVTLRERYLPLITERRSISLFEQLPLYVRYRILKEGKVVLCKDETALYDVAYRTAQTFEDYRPYYQRYLEEVGRAGS
jgi:predicted nucleotidyltransferase